MTTLRGGLGWMMMSLLIVLAGCRDKQPGGVQPTAPDDTTGHAWVRTVEHMFVSAANALPDGGVLAYVDHEQGSFWRIWPDGDSMRIWDFESLDFPPPNYLPPLLRSAEGCLLCPADSSLNCMDGDWAPVWSVPLDTLHLPGYLCAGPNGDIWAHSIPAGTPAGHQHGALRLSADGNLLGWWVYSHPDTAPPPHTEYIERARRTFPAPDGGCWLVGTTEYRDGYTQTSIKLWIVRVNSDGSAGALFRSGGPDDFPAAAAVNHRGELWVMIPGRRPLRFEPSGELAADQPASEPIPDGQVYCMLVLDDGHMLVGGQIFEAYEPDPVAEIVELDESGAIVNIWRLDGYDKVAAMVLLDDRRLLVFASNNQLNGLTAAIKSERDRP